MAWLAVVLAAARESFQVKDLGAELTPLLFLFFTLSASRRSIGANINFAWLSDLSLRTAISGGSLSRTGACLHASRSRVCCFEPVFFAIQRRSVSKKIQCSSPYIYIYMLPRIGLAVAALSSSQGFCRFEPGCGDRDTSVFFGTVDGRRVPSACFTVHRPLRGLFLFSAACATWCCFRHLVTSRDL